MSVIHESFTRFEKVETTLARAVIGLPTAAMRAVVGRPIVRDGNVLDPQAQLVLTLHERLGKKAPNEVPLDVARREFDVACRQLGFAPSVLATTVSSRVVAGRPSRVYRPRGAATGGPALVFFHGGGFALGSLDGYDLVCRALAEAAPCTVIAVDYRLAPEHRFPAAVDDATAAFRAVVAEADSLGVDPRRVAVGGDSAGGNLAAVVSLDTRDDDVRPCVQFLIYPAVDMTMSFPSMDTLAKGFLLEKHTIQWYRDRYIDPADHRHPRASPWFAESLAGLPPAVVVTAGFDPLRDEGNAYAERLRKAGVCVQHRCYGDMFHGFWNATGIIHAARSAFDETIASLRTSLRA